MIVLLILALWALLFINELTARAFNLYAATTDTGQQFAALAAAHIVHHVNHLLLLVGLPRSSTSREALADSQFLCNCALVVDW